MANVLITGITGFQGKAVAEQLDKSKYNVTGFTSEPAKVDSSLYRVGEGNFNDVKSIINTLKGIDYVYFVLPLQFDKELLLNYTKNFIEAAQTAKPKLIVFNSSVFVPQQPTGILAFDIKLEVEKLLRQSGLPIIYLHPRVYLDNLAAPWSVPAIFNQGVLPYPVPADQKISWISLYDLARFTAAAFEKPELAGSTFEIAAKAITGNEIAEELSAVLNKKIQYVAISPDDFEKGLKEPFGELAAKSISDIYRYSAVKGEDFIVKSDVSNVLGIQPLEFKQWSANVPWAVLNEQFSEVVK